MVCLEGVPDGVSNALEVFQSIPEFPGFWVSGKDSGVRSGRVGAHWKDTGDIGNNRGSPYRRQRYLPFLQMSARYLADWKRNA